MISRVTKKIHKHETVQNTKQRTVQSILPCQRTFTQYQEMRQLIGGSISATGAEPRWRGILYGESSKMERHLVW
jgi:hypothetical protein